jgi:hypothetical protein
MTDDLSYVFVFGNKGAKIASNIFAAVVLKTQQKTAPIEAFLVSLSR